MKTEYLLLLGLGLLVLGGGTAFMFKPSPAKDVYVSTLEQAEMVQVDGLITKEEYESKYYATGQPKTTPEGYPLPISIPTPEVIEAIVEQKAKRYVFLGMQTTGVFIAHDYMTDTRLYVNGGTILGWYASGEIDLSDEALTGIRYNM